MRYANEIKKFGALALLLSIFTALTSSAASAADIPSLLWERGRQQTITLGGASAENSWSIRLVGPGKTQEFKKSVQNSDGFYVYSVNIPRDQKIGDYRVLVSSADRPDELVAYVNISKSISYNLLSDPEALGILAVVLTTLVSSFSGNLGNVGGSDGFEEGNPDDPYPSDQNTGTVDSIGSDSLVTSDNEKGSFDQLRLGRIGFVATIDALRHSWIQGLAPRTRVWMRVIADASWLQAIFGPLALLSPIVGACLGITIFATHNFSTTVIPSATPALIALFAVGVFDAMAGATGAFALFISIIISGKVHSTADIRGLMGVAVLFFLPILIAGTMRPLRRLRAETPVWERITDYLVAPLFTFWSVKSLVSAIDGFAQQQTELSQSAVKLAIISSTLIVIRLACEDLAHNLAPARIEYLSAPKVRTMDSYYLLVSIGVKTAIYLFFMYGFLQFSWQGLVAVAFLVTPQIIKLYGDRIPNFPLLFQIIPGGVPGTVFTALLGIAISKWVNMLPLVAEDKSRTIFVLVGIPGFILSMLKIFGRSPKDGDVRWYRRPKYNLLYRPAGVVMFFAALSLVSGVFS